MSTPFFSREWAAAAREAWNAGPTEEARAGKIEKFWEWIEDAKQDVNCRLALAVRGLPGADASCLLLDLEAGRCTDVKLLPHEEGEELATYLLVGGYADWQDIMSGYDAGKTIMYRKLLLEKGEVLEFFKSAYFWTESLACLQRVPTSFP